MWIYEKRLQFPVNIKETNAQLAQAIISQYGGPDGEMGASMRYLSQRYAMPDNKVKAILTDIGTEELGHLEIVATIIYQLTCRLSIEEIKASGFDKYYIDHTLGIWPQAAAAFHLTPANSRARVIRSRIFSKIWQQSRKPGRLMTISCVSARTIRMYMSRSNSFVNVRSHISSVSVKALALSVTRWIQRTSMHLTQHLIQVLHAWRNAGSRR